MAVSLQKLPVAILTDMDVLQEAAAALQEREALQQAVRDSDHRIRVLCRQYGDAARIWGVAPHHLAQACKARGLL